MDNDKKNFCSMYPPLWNINYIDTDIVSNRNKENFYMGGFTKPLKEINNMFYRDGSIIRNYLKLEENNKMTKEEQEHTNETLKATKLDTFKAWHWLQYLLDGGQLDENRIKYLRTFCQVICDILSDHEIYSTNDLRWAMDELVNIQELNDVREKLNVLDEKICDIIQSIEKGKYNE